MENDINLEVKRITKEIHIQRIKILHQMQSNILASTMKSDRLDVGFYNEQLTNYLKNVDNIQNVLYIEDEAEEDDELRYL